MSFRKNILFASIAYLLGAVIFFPYLRYYLDNPDTISYIAVAQKFAEGNFAEAVNGYWSPLICWLLAIPLKLNIDVIISFKILQLITGWFALWQWLLLVEIFLKRPFFRIAVSFSVIPFLLSFAYLNLTADLLFLALTLMYLNMVCRAQYLKRKHGIVAGLIGAVLYLCKSFGFVFFIVHFSLILIYKLCTETDSVIKKHFIRNYLIAMVCFSLISGGWIVLLSNKYQHFTISEAAVFNFSKEVAPSVEKQIELPILSGGLYSPSNATAINAWEDPKRLIKYAALKPLSSSSDLHAYFQIVKRNVLSVYYYDFRRQTGAVFFILLLLFFSLPKLRKFLFAPSFITIFSAVITFYLFYMLILVHPRYVWICSLLMLLMIVYMLQSMIQEITSDISKRFLYVIAVFILLLAVKRPLKELFFMEDKTLSPGQLVFAAVNPFEQLQQTYALDKDLFVVSDSLSKLLEKNKKMASVKDNDSARDNYARSSVVAFKTGNKYLGQAECATVKEFNDSLQHYDVNYLLLWKNETDGCLDSSFMNRKKIYSNQLIPLQVYEVKSSTSERESSVR